MKVLLHACCAPCCAAILEWMLNNGVQPVIYYCNPNIYPEQEYLKRKAELTRYATKLGVEIIDDDYDHDDWLEGVKFKVDGLRFKDEGSEFRDYDPATEPERGRRCLLCFRYRLERAARKCAELGLETFTTSLASSRWKNLEQINQAGADAAERHGVHFDDRNWRKGGLQERRNALLKQEGFYNQLWCGCEFSCAKK